MMGAASAAGPAYTWTQQPCPGFRDLSGAKSWLYEGPSPIIKVLADKWEKDRNHKFDAQCTLCPNGSNESWLNSGVLDKVCWQSTASGKKLRMPSNTQYLKHVERFHKDVYKPSNVSAARVDKTQRSANTDEGGNSHSPWSAHKTVLAGFMYLFMLCSVLSIPRSLSRNKHARGFFEFLDPKFTCPDITATMKKAQFAKEVLVLKQKSRLAALRAWYGKKPFLAGSTDAATEKHSKQGFVSLDNQFVNENFEMETMTFGVVHVPAVETSTETAVDEEGNETTTTTVKSGHDAKGNARAIKNLSKKFGILVISMWYIAFTTDGAKYQENAIVKELQIPWIYCYAHRMNLAIKKALGIQHEKQGAETKKRSGNLKMEEYVAKMKKIVTMFSHSPKQTERLSKLKLEHEAELKEEAATPAGDAEKAALARGRLAGPTRKFKHLQQDVVTRWTSLYVTFLSFLVLWVPLTRFFTQHGSDIPKKHKQRPPSGAELDIAVQVVTVLKAPMELITDIQSESRPTLDTAFCRAEQLKGEFKRGVHKPVKQHNSDKREKNAMEPHLVSDEVKAFLHLATAQFDKSFDAGKLSDVEIKCMMFNPVIKAAVPHLVGQEKHAAIVKQLEIEIHELAVECDDIEEALEPGVLRPAAAAAGSDSEDEPAVPLAGQFAVPEAQEGDSDIIQDDAYGLRAYLGMTYHFTPESLYGSGSTSAEQGGAEPEAKQPKLANMKATDKRLKNVDMLRFWRTWHGRALMPVVMQMSSTQDGTLRYRSAAALARTAARYLGVPATSAMSERAFSQLAHLLGPLVSQMDHENVTLLLFLNKNLDYLQKHLNAQALAALWEFGTAPAPEADSQVTGEALVEGPDLLPESDDDDGDTEQQQ
jgi:hypothetical protein